MNHSPDFSNQKNTPEFIHFTRRGNRDIPTATKENLIALLVFYNFRITEKKPNTFYKEWCGISFDDFKCTLRLNAADIADGDVQLLKNLDVKLHLQSLCGRHELPIKTLDFMRIKWILKGFLVQFEYDCDNEVTLYDAPMICGELVGDCHE